MPYCPFISYGKQYVSEVECMGEECILWSYNRDSCLVRLALLKYAADVPSGKEKSIEDQIKELQNQMKAVSLGFPMMGTIEKDWFGLQGGL